MNKTAIRQSHAKQPEESLEQTLRAIREAAKALFTGSVSEKPVGLHLFDIYSNLKNCYSSRSLLLQAACSKNS